MSTKRFETRFQSGMSICKFNLLSSCAKGRKCPFLHSVCDEQYSNEPKLTGQKNLCYFFLKGRCTDGASCQRSHNLPPSFNGTIKKVCHYFSQGRCDRGKLCSYIHILPDNYSPVSIIADSPPSSCQSESNNVVSPLVINTGDDIYSMSVTPKLCRFYRRGMCFFGEHCINFHDKPETYPEDFISNLRKDEVLNEKNELDEINSLDKGEKISNNMSMVLAENKEIGFNVLKVVHGSSDWDKSHDDANSSSKSEKVLKVSFDSSSKPNKFEVSHEKSNKFKASSKSDKMIREQSSSTKSVELIKDPCSSSKSIELTKNEFSSSKSNEFARTARNSSNSKIFARDTYSSSKPKEFFNKSHTSSKPNGLSKSTYTSSKSKEFARDAHSLNSSELNRDWYNSSKSKEFSKSIYYSNSQSKDFSNVLNQTKSRQYFRVQYSYRPKRSYSSQNRNNYVSKELYKNVVKSKEIARNSNNLKEQLRNASIPLKLAEQSRNPVCSLNSIERPEIADGLSQVKAEELYNTTNKSLDSNGKFNGVMCNSKSRKQYIYTDSFNEDTEPGICCAMTRKQSKSQRKPKSENIESRIFFKRLFFKTPVTVKHVTKKL